jgi:hypothetical protein
LPAVPVNGNPVCAIAWQIFRRVLRGHFQARLEGTFSGEIPDAALNLPQFRVAAFPLI